MAMFRVLNLFRFYFKTEMLFGMSVQRHIYVLTQLCLVLFLVKYLFPLGLSSVLAIILVGSLMYFTNQLRNTIRRIVTCGADPVVSGVTLPLFFCRLSYDARRLILGMVMLSMALFVGRQCMTGGWSLTLPGILDIAICVVGFWVSLMLTRLELDLASIVLGERRTACELREQEIEQPALTIYPTGASILLPIVLGGVFILSIGLSKLIVLLPFIPIVFVWHALITPNTKARRAPWISLWSMRLFGIALCLFGAFIHVFPKDNYGIDNALVLLTIMLLTLLSCEMTYTIIGIPTPEAQSRD
mgnify:CR=1 FL=1